MKREIPFIAVRWRQGLLSVNEGYGPINFTIQLKPLFAYIYFFGRRWWYPK